MRMRAYLRRFLLHNLAMRCSLLTRNLRAAAAAAAAAAAETLNIGSARRLTLHTLRAACVVVEATL